MKNLILVLFVAMVLIFAHIEGVLVYAKVNYWNAKSEATQEIVSSNIKPEEETYSILSSNEEKKLSGNIGNIIETLEEKRGYYVFQDESEDKVCIAIFAGEKSTAGHEIEIDKVEKIEECTQITLKEATPKRELNMLQVITYPYIIIKMENYLGKIEVKTEDGEKFNNLTPQSIKHTKRAWIDLPRKLDVSEDKEWSIRFNKEIRKAVLNNQSIFVRDFQGNNIATKIVMNSDKESIKIIPTAPYSSKQTYYLYVNAAELDEEYGNNGYRMSFTIH